WYFFGSFVALNGIDVVLFVSQLFANEAASGFSADILLTVVVFVVWSFKDSKENDLKNWWVVPIAVLTVGLSLAVPLYLYIREGRHRA
ncbi:MAG: DUF2834 domain-containing protein, partial [Alphaproteobacteria bacterium]|nr:DUF2834 domain-containing protein [Alphaproteobacteria bacterium]